MVAHRVAHKADQEVAQKQSTVLEQPYVGRFAPSPTGPLHFGSLVAALASFLDARANAGRWLLRIEDLDPPRESPLAPAQIIQQLQTYNLDWDESPLYQSERLDAYQAAIDTIQANSFACTCTRKATRGIYLGTCRNQQLSDQPAVQASAIRLRVHDSVTIQDRILGQHCWHLEDEIGDFIIRRKDGLFAYQLAVVVDDAFQKVTQVMRGSDLLNSTPRQVYLAQCLEYQPVEYAHFPVILGTDGHKLSKQAHAEPLSTEDPMTVLNLALKALQQPKLTRSSVRKMLNYAIENWQLGTIKPTMAIPLSDLIDLP